MGPMRKSFGSIAQIIFQEKGDSQSFSEASREISAHTSRICVWMVRWIQSISPSNVPEYFPFSAVKFPCILCISSKEPVKEREPKSQRSICHLDGEGLETSKEIFSGTENAQSVW